MREELSPNGSYLALRARYHNILGVAMFLLFFILPIIYIPSFNTWISYLIISSFIIGSVLSFIWFNKRLTAIEPLGFGFWFDVAAYYNVRFRLAVFMILGGALGILFSFSYEVVIQGSNPLVLLIPFVFFFPLVIFFLNTHSKRDHGKRARHFKINNIAGNPLIEDCVKGLGTANSYEKTDHGPDGTTSYRIPDFGISVDTRNQSDGGMLVMISPYTPEGLHHVETADIPPPSGGGLSRI